MSTPLAQALEKLRLLPRFAAGLMLATGLLPAAEPAASDRMTIPGLNYLLVKLPGGTFTMGNDAAESDEKPAHQVTLSKDFWMGTTTITVGQWKFFVEKTGYVTESEHNNKGIFVKRDLDRDNPGPVKFTNWRNPAIPNNYQQTDNHPVVGISWDDVQQFLIWLNDREGAAGRLPAGYVYRLPSEAQWEYAARAGSTKNRPDNPHDVAWFAENSGGHPQPVGTKKANAWGLHDMLGNVWQWTHSWYGKYPEGPVTDPEGPAAPWSTDIMGQGPLREIRGGQWAVANDNGLSPAQRWGPTWGIHAANWIGFRIALAPPPPPLPYSMRPIYPADMPGGKAPPPGAAKAKRNLDKGAPRKENPK
jgi:formylglycine-generating enzyme required for sulfatase activity